MPDEESFMRRALEAARKCKSEQGKVSPKVGAVVVLKDGTSTEAYRGELAPGEHAEYTALERKLKDDIVAGATVYTTLEPCTSRHDPKVPCAERLIERKVSRVVIGMVDPNPTISGRGIRRLREANITVDMFPAPFAGEIEELNREFSRDQKTKPSLPSLDGRQIELLRVRSLDDIFRGANSTYWNQNYHRDASSIFAHLVEVVGGLSALASSKKKPGVSPEGHIAKAFAWWLALCGKLGIRSVEEMLWDKFPGVCPYWQKIPHDPDICSFEKAKHHGPNWDGLAAVGQKSQRPKRVRDWQRMFSRIYPAQQTEDFGPSFARLAEES
jgi:pyrimidine deaminase RibD-like protein